MRTNFYIFRHGQTDWNKEARLQGHSDIPLNDTGRSQASSLREKFENIIIDHVYSSDLIRAQATAMLAFGEECKLILSKNLREINVGDFEGVHRDNLEEDMLQKVLTGAHFTFKGGESTAQHAQRVISELMNIYKNHQGQNIAISTHGGSMARILEACPTFDRSTYIENCSLALVSAENDEFKFHHFL